MRTPEILKIVQLWCRQKIKEKVPGIILVFYPLRGGKREERYEPRETYEEVQEQTEDAHQIISRSVEKL